MLHYSPSVSGEQQSQLSFLPPNPHSSDNGRPSTIGRFDTVAGGVGARDLPRTIGPDGVLCSANDSGIGENLQGGRNSDEKPGKCFIIDRGTQTGSNHTRAS